MAAEEPVSPDVEGEGSVTRWIGDIKEGDREAMERLWSRYFQRLATLARKRLTASRRLAGPVNEEDVALGAEQPVGPDLGRAAPRGPGPRRAVAAPGRDHRAR